MNFTLHQLQVVDEKSELDKKLEALDQFISASSVYMSLEPEEKTRLKSQEAHMHAYSKILSERIAIFK